MKDIIRNLCEDCTVKVSRDYDGKKIQSLKSPFQCECCKQIVKSGATWRLWLKVPE